MAITVSTFPKEDILEATTTTARLLQSFFNLFLNETQAKVFQEGDDECLFNDLDVYSHGESVSVEKVFSLFLEDELFDVVNVFERRWVDILFFSSCLWFMG